MIGSERMHFMKRTPECLNILEPGPLRLAWAAGYLSQRQRERAKDRTAWSADCPVLLTSTLLDMGMSLPRVWTETGIWLRSLSQDKTPCTHSLGWWWESWGILLSTCSSIYSGVGSSVNSGWMSSQLSLNLSSLRTLNLAPILSSTRAVRR